MRLEIKRFILVIMVLTAIAALVAYPTRTGTKRSEAMPESASQVTETTYNNNYSGRTRNPIPPTNLRAQIFDNVNVRLNWDLPTDLLRLFYHSGHPHDAYIQFFDEGFGTVFDMRDYQNATIEFVDFRHSSFDLLGEWQYSIILLDWDTRELLATVNTVTTVNDGWERDIAMYSVPVSEGERTTDFLGVFIVPRGNESNDAYPVIDFDFNMEGNSMIISIDNEGYHFEEEADGDFLIDLLIRPGQQDRNSSSGIVSAPRKERRRPDALRQKTAYRPLYGYNIYRDEELIDGIDNPDILMYEDRDLEEGTYYYSVTALYETEGESAPTDTVMVNIVPDMEDIFYDDFSSYPNFTMNFPPWRTVDLDGGDTYGFENHNFPNQTLPMAFIIFNPAAATPPIQNMPPHSGSKFVASFASIQFRNNNWLISPHISLGSNSSLSFYVRTYNAEWGLERFRVGISTTDPEPGSFEIIYPASPAQYAEAPVVWSEVEVDLSLYDGQEVYIAINCVSDDTFIFMLDSFRVRSVGGLSAEEPVSEPLKFTAGNYPNPFNPETNIYFDIKEEGFVSLEIYNIRGQLVNTLVDDFLQSGRHIIGWDGKDSTNSEVASGVYYYKITSETDTYHGKMLLMK